MNKSSDVFETEGQSFQCYEDDNGKKYYNFKKIVDFIGFSKSYKRTLRNSIFRDCIIDVEDKLYITREGLDKLLHRSRKDIAERMSKDFRKKNPDPNPLYNNNFPKSDSDSITKETKERLKNIREELRKERKKREASESKTKSLEKEIEKLEYELELKLNLED